MVGFMAGGPILVAVVTHPDKKVDTIKRLRELIGPCDSRDPTTIRGKYRLDGSPSWENLVHASDSPESAEREIKLWYSRGVEE